jgi:hypothetical protein
MGIFGWITANIVAIIVGVLLGWNLHVMQG